MIKPEQLRTQVTQFLYSHCGQANQFELLGAQGSRARASMHGEKNSSPTISISALILRRRCQQQTDTPFDAKMCAVVEELRPEVVSFYYGLPEAELVKRVTASGCKIFALRPRLPKCAFWKRTAVTP
jgi:NAD(P)H-dependent flavin oxidoreductase YrpB (nitropropane dioxygenase family)